MKGKFSTLMLAVIIINIALVIPVIPVQASRVWHVYNGEIIQDVVDAASPSDTIIVHAGTYKQTWIKKSLTLIGENALIIPEPPNGGSIGFMVSSGIIGTPVQGVKISGFTINAPDTAIFLYGVSNSEITRNKAKGGHYGILLAGASSNNDITENEAEGGLAGISLQDGASNNEITRNKVKGYLGIWLYPNEEAWGPLGYPTYGDPYNNEITENKVKYVFSNYWYSLFGIWVGIWVDGDNNEICFNRVSGKGIDLLDMGIGNEWKGNKYKTSIGL